MRRLFLRDCEPGDVIDDVFVVANKQLSATTTGKHFIKAFLSDRTAQLTARMWNASREIFNYLPENGFVKVRGRIENYQNNLQVIIETVGPAVEGAYDVADLLPTTDKDVRQMLQRLHELLGSVQNRHLAAILQAYLDDQELMDRFARCPAAMSFHHAYIGGLLEHTLNAMEVADAVVKFYPGLNRDLVLAGVFLHDIAKTWELQYESAFAYSDAGQLVGHIVKGAIWVEEKARIAEEALGERIPRILIDVLQHIILAHHGDYEFGSPRLPSTPEAIAVHMIENLDAKLMMALRACREEAGGEGNWTEHLKSLGGKLFRPDVAPADAPLTEELPADAPSQADATRRDAPRAVPTPSQGSKGAAPGGAPTGARNEAASAPPAQGEPLRITNPLFATVPARNK
ncbi:MAG: HD domain-containing protein [Phycisphaerae bacterium]|nr:HD domain-containing protein [Phycisphaerae bacterium]MDW8263307.1 HD domain-containing protein [Phycisphaerales bacterium]